MGRPMFSDAVALGEALVEYLSSFPSWNCDKILKATYLWKLFLRTCQDLVMRKSFLSMLSSSQTTSARLLLLWKSGTLISAESYRSLPGAKPDIEVLNTEFERLFQMEFELPSKQAQRRSTDLYTCRQAAAQTFAYRQVLKSYLRSNNIMELPIHIQHKYIALERQVRDDSGGSLLSSTISSCDSSSEKQPHIFPFYLWDTQEQRTVETHSLDPKPGYIVISHTWGRWKKNGCRIDMRPIVPWTVPENKVFSVQNLPAGLSALVRQFESIPHVENLRYVWIDLFCIPQDGSAKAKEEIAQQAGIFGNATIAVFWSNTTTSWKFLSQIMSWTILDSLQRGGAANSALKLSKYLSLANTSPRLAEKLRAVISLLDSRRILDMDDDLISQSQEFEEFDQRLNLFTLGWLSSLWTLQEIYLRPDMLFVNKTWDVFKIDEGTPVAVDTLLYFLGIPNESYLRSFQSDYTPRPVSFIKDILKNSCIGSVFIENPLNALALGGARYCSKNRSEAVMSVLGCVEWYQEYTTREHSIVQPLGPGPQIDRLRVTLSPDQIVLDDNLFDRSDTYNYEFVEEVRQRYGYVFFGSQYSKFSEWPDIAVTKMTLGSILPFTFVSSEGFDWGTRSIVPFTNDVAEEGSPRAPNKIFLQSAREVQFHTGHASVISWALCRDGTVRIQEAGILIRAPSLNPQQLHPSGHELNELPCHITGPEVYDFKYPLSFDNPDSFHYLGGLTVYDEPLAPWMERFPVETPRYAVVLCSSTMSISGIILAEIQVPSGATWDLKDLNSGSSILAKWGEFSIQATLGTPLPPIPETEKVNWIII